MSVSVVSGVVSAGAAVYGASKAGSASKTLARKANAREQEMWDMQQQRMSDWDDTYGSLEDNLAEYYNNLTPELKTVQGLEAFEKEKGLALDNLRDTLAQRGISQSGIAAQTETAVALSSAEERARIRAAAPMETAKEKMGFLNVGLGNDPSSDLAATATAQANNARSQANLGAQQAGNATANAIGAVTDLATTAYDTYQDYKANKVEVATPSTPVISPT